MNLTSKTNNKDALRQFSRESCPILRTDSSFGAARTIIRFNCDYPAWLKQEGCPVAGKIGRTQRPETRE